MQKAICNIHLPKLLSSNDPNCSFAFTQNESLQMPILGKPLQEIKEQINERD